MRKAFETEIPEGCEPVLKTVGNKVTLSFKPLFNYTHLQVGDIVRFENGGIGLITHYGDDYFYSFNLNNDLSFSRYCFNENFVIRYANEDETAVYMDNLKSSCLRWNGNKNVFELIEWMPTYGSRMFVIIDNKVTIRTFNDSEETRRIIASGLYWNSLEVANEEFNAIKAFVRLRKKARLDLRKLKYPFVSPDEESPRVSPKDETLNR